MSVYVDKMRTPYRAGKKTLIMCHMLADTLEELHTMAAKLGVRRWFQAEGSFSHYDICLSKRQLAISLGAIELKTNKEVAEMMRHFREAVE